MLYDLSGNGNHGTIYGATWTDGICGSALDFDDRDEYVSVPVSTSSTFTIAAWINPHMNNPEYQLIFEREGNFVIEYRSMPPAIGNKIIEYTYHWPNMPVSNTDLGVNTWNFVTIVRTPDTAFFYLNGAPDGSGEDFPISLSGTYNIGDRPGPQDFQFDGIIDEFRIYDRELSAEEIQSLYDDACTIPVSVPEEFTVEVFAEVTNPGGLAFQPPGSETFTSFLYVGSNSNPVGTLGIPDEMFYDDKIFEISEIGDVSLFATLYGESDPVALELPPLLSVYGDFLYISANNRDGYAWGDEGGTILRIGHEGGAYSTPIPPPQVPPTDNSDAFTPVGEPDEPYGIAFGPNPDGYSNTTLMLANSSDAPAGIVQVNTSGDVLSFLNGSLVPMDVEFGPGGGFESYLYFAEYQNYRVYTADASGLIYTPFVTLPTAGQFHPRDIEFSHGCGFGNDLYVAASTPSDITNPGGKIYRVKNDGTYTEFATGLGLLSVDSMEFSPDGNALYVADFSRNKVYKIFPVAVTDEEGPATFNVVADPNPVPVNTDVELTAFVDDGGTCNSDIDSAEYSLDESTWHLMGVPFSGPSGTVTAMIPKEDLAEAGVYNLCVHGTDAADNTGPDECIFLVVYDPDGGFVTGGGWIDSPSEAYTPDDPDDEDFVGKANFGFVSKYKKGATVPTGNTEFMFKAADLNFHSDEYDWLVVTGSDYARFKGLGTINGEGDYKFMLWAGDGELDTFRIKIWLEDEVTAEETIIYDNGFGQEIGGGSIVIHTKKK